MSVEVRCCCDSRMGWNIVKVVGVGSLACAGTIIASQSQWSWAAFIVGGLAGGAANALSSFAWKSKTDERVDSLQEQVDKIAVQVGVFAKLTEVKIATS